MPTDSSTPPAFQYQFRADAPRCEGLFTKVVAGGEGMSLVSLTVGAVNYDLKKDQAVEMTLLQPAAATRIQAIGIPLQLYYRLDAELSSSRTTLRVPLKDVLAPRQIEAAQLGVYGLRRLPDGRSGYVPVRVGTTEASPAKIVAVVRPGSDVTNVAWRLYERGRTTPWVPLPDAAGLVAQGQKLTMQIGDSLPTGESTFELSYYLDGLPRTDRFTLLSR